jgi:hypothetical protein
MFLYFMCVYIGLKISNTYSLLCFHTGYLICTYIVLKFNNNFSLCFRILCNSNNGEIGDEFHYLSKCQYFVNQRKIYIKKNIRINPNIIKFKLLMTSTSKIELQILCRFVRIINKGVSTPG